MKIELSFNSKPTSRKKENAVSVVLNCGGSLDKNGVAKIEFGSPFDNYFIHIFSLAKNWSSTSLVIDGFDVNKNDFARVTSCPMSGECKGICKVDKRHFSGFPDSATSVISSIRKKVPLEGYYKLGNFSIEDRRVYSFLSDISDNTYQVNKKEMFEYIEKMYKDDYEPRFCKFYSKDKILDAIESLPDTFVKADADWQYEVNENGLEDHLETLEEDEDYQIFVKENIYLAKRIAEEIAPMIAKAIVEELKPYIKI